MNCARCERESPPGVAKCDFCGALFGPQLEEKAPPPEPPSWKRYIFHPVSAMVMGLLFFPLAKLLYIPAYVFNFLSTLVHECGHAIFAIFVGRPSIPTVSPLGGGVTIWQDPILILQLLIWGGIGFLGWKFRKSRLILITCGVMVVLYPFLAFTNLNELIAIGGGVFLEVAAASACFFTVFALRLDRPFERPLYALWGWWMVLNRGGETILMLSDKGYWHSQAVIESGLAAGLTSDLERLRGAFGVDEALVLLPVLIFCFLSLPIGIGLAWWWRKVRPEPSTE